MQAGTLTIQHAHHLCTYPPVRKLTCDIPHTPRHRQKSSYHTTAVHWHTPLARGIAHHVIHTPHHRTWHCASAPRHDTRYTRYIHHTTARGIAHQHLDMTRDTHDTYTTPSHVAPRQRLTELHTALHGIMFIVQYHEASHAITQHDHNIDCKALHYRTASCTITRSRSVYIYSHCMTYPPTTPTRSLSVHIQPLHDLPSHHTH